MKTKHFLLTLLLLATFLICRCFADSSSLSTNEGGWIDLFNGQDLDDWTVKFAGSPAGENLHNIYRVEDGILKVSYDGYDKFDMRFGHIFHKTEYSHYILRVEYLFLGKGLADAPHWTNFNSGVMLHAQSPQSMRLEQGFPVSIEAQFLAEKATAGTQTGNIVTPGTHVEIDGKLNKEHIIDSSSRLYPLGEWVRFEAEVHGSKEIIYRVNGEEVNRLQHPQLDDSDRDAQKMLTQGADKFLGSGYIALQAEAQPVWFRNIKVRALRVQN